eukprot:6386133-Alexandrium_andersonii.AAC.1
MPAREDELRPEHPQQLAPVRLLRRLPAGGLRQHQGPVAPLALHGQGPQVRAPLQGGRGLQRRRGLGDARLRAHRGG